MRGASPDGAHPGLCIALGETAASIIVCANKCLRWIFNDETPNYTQTCREVAYGICKGAIKDKIKQQCPDKLPVSTTELNFLIVWSKWTA